MSAECLTLFKAVVFTDILQVVSHCVSLGECLSCVLSNTVVRCNHWDNLFPGMSILARHPDQCSLLVVIISSNYSSHSSNWPPAHLWCGLSAVVALWCLGCFCDNCCEMLHTSWWWLYCSPCLSIYVRSSTPSTVTCMVHPCLCQQRGIIVIEIKVSKCWRNRLLYLVHPLWLLVDQEALPSIRTPLCSHGFSFDIDLPSDP